MDQDDVGFETQDKDIKPSKQAHEVDFKVFDPAQIQAQQDKQVTEVSSILGQPPEASAILLRHLRWNKERLIDQYMEKTDEVLESAGLGPDSANNPPKLQKVKGFVCDICCDDNPNMDTFAMKCQHRFCVDCYRQYLGNKILDEGEAARIRCPGEGCTRIVDSRSLDLLVTADLQDRYVRKCLSSQTRLTILDTTYSSHEPTLMIKRISNGVRHLIASMPLNALSRARISAELCPQFIVIADTTSVLAAP